MMDFKISTTQHKLDLPRKYTPTDGEVVEAVTSIWEAADFRTEKLTVPQLHTVITVRHPDWSLSANRIKTCLKAADMMPQSQESRQFSKQTTSKDTPELDVAEITNGLVKVVRSKAKGKGLHAVREIKEGTELWQEKPALLAIPLLLLGIARKSIACAYCGRSFQLREEVQQPTSEHQRGTPGSTSCLAEECGARYCNVECRSSDIAHSAMWHSTANNKIQSEDWLEFENYCLEHQWMGAYAYGVILVTCLRVDNQGKNAGKKTSDSPVSLLKQQYDSMASVSHDVKVLANPSDDVDIDAYKEEWLTAHELLAKVVRRVYDLSYDEFLQGIGRYSLNNLDAAIYLLGSHVNHSCEPNISISKDAARTDPIVVTASADIKAGEELRVCYVNPNLDVNERADLLLKNWGFVCTCARCKRELKEFEVVEIDSTGAIKPPPTTERSRRKSVRFDATEKPDLS